MCRILLLASLAAFTACASSNDRPALAVPSGEWRQLNAGRWDWAGNEIAQAPRDAAMATGLSR